MYLITVTEQDFNKARQIQLMVESHFGKSVEIQSRIAADANPLYALGIGSAGVAAPDKTLAEMEREAIVAHIALAHGNISTVARRLGIGRSTLYRKMKEYNIDIRELHPRRTTRETPNTSEQAAAVGVRNAQLVA